MTPDELRKLADLYRTGAHLNVSYLFRQAADEIEKLREAIEVACSTCKRILRAASAGKGEG